MKKITLFYFMLALSMSSYAQYCAVAGKVNTDTSFNVSGVVTTGGDTNINMSGATNGTNNYTNVNQTVTLDKGKTFNLSVTQGNAYSRVMIWIDWNGDGDFEETGEYIGVYGAEKTTANALTLVANITVPPATANGEKKMRILSGDAYTYTDADGYIPWVPCNSSNDTLYFVDIKDFKLSVTGVTASVDDFENKVNFQLYPNPVTTNVINIQMNIQNEEVTAELYSITGKLIQKNNFKSFSTSQQINISSISKGIYILTVRVDDKKITRKIIK